MKLMLLLALLTGAVWAQPSDLAAIAAEKDPEKRYVQALDFAASRIGSARKHYQHGEIEAFRAALSTMKEAVELSDATLRGTGQNPSKKPKHFKRAELKIRDMLKRLRNFAQDVSVIDRDVVTTTHARLNVIHEELLLDIMGRRK